MTQKKTGASRRDFFKTMGAAGAASLLLGPGSALAAETMTAPRRPFGNSGVQVSTLSLGGMFDIVTNQLVLHQALKLGVDYWDTAYSYTGGRSEEGIGRYFTRFPKVRERIFLVTKAHRRTPEDLQEQLEESLQRLKTSYVDLFFVHAIREPGDVNQPEIKAWAAKMKKQGKIKLFGFSTHRNMAECLAAAPGMGFIDGIMMTYNYRIMHDKDMNQAVEACHKAGIGLTAMKTQGGGPVADDSEGEMQLGGRFLKKGFSPFQAKMMAIWEDQRIAAICSQMPNLTILQANAAASMSRTALSAGDRRALAAHARATAGCYCAGCAGICEDALDGVAPVADVMRGLMYARSHRDLELARQTLAEALPAGPEALLAMDFSPAQAACPQGLPIARLMREAAEEMA
ncbi:MAG: aldo/keto reductase [Desulfarculaceae bacterium]|nr:aldo/keto reductase [Desulfarculaceae bacterium]MCF8072792.1 aldo/keto reductase [Desulfarculaceae bacterium]MCF8100960.1 aldo/keto reductase [Desulfarculaceae bacterium]MCF8118524.1 aldo/keto reductase [Desulfarculaceae bacterium]